MSAADLLAKVPPPSEEVITLTCVDLFFSAIFVPVSGYIAWKHGKPGMLTWPNLTSAAVSRIVWDVYLLVQRHKPLVPSVVSDLINASVLACLSLALVGVVYLCNRVLPTPPRRRVDKYLLLSLHVTNTAGLSMGFTLVRALQVAGNIILMVVLLAVCAWMWPTYRKIQSYAKIGHPNAVPARRMFWAAAAAMPFWMARVATSFAYAWTQRVDLEVVLGSFAVKFLVLFWMYLGAMALLMIGGWSGAGWQREVGTTSEWPAGGDHLTPEWRRAREREMRRLMGLEGDRAAADVVNAVGTPEVTEQVVRPKASHASSFTLYTARNLSLQATRSSRTLRPKASRASSTLAEGGSLATSRSQRFLQSSPVMSGAGP